ncbi:MAG: hypothetical protein LBC70_09835 [Chitinispirillales bacterium]|jgi:long-subunit fatty acid transport protein|nr:hypothetical protein [Chitinispirillales bacterium]
MKKSFFVILTFCAAATAANSLLGLHYPFGTPVPAATGASSAMGGSGTAVVEEYFGTALNPANAAIGNRAAFSAQASFSLTNIADNGASSTVWGYAPEVLSLVLPIGRAGNIGFSMLKQSDAGLNFYTTEILQDDPDAFKSTTIELHRKGGMTSWQAGWAYRFANGLAVGLIYERLYYNENTRDVFESIFRYHTNPTSAPFRANVTEMVATMAASDGVRFGVQIPVNETFTLGAAVEYILPGDGNGKITREHWRSGDAFAYEKTESHFSISLPPSINIGAAYRPDQRWLFAADAHSTLWEGYDDSRDDNSAHRTFGISAGARFIPAAGLLVSTYPEKIHYSAGLRYSTLPSPLRNESVAHEYALSFGTGLPIPGDGGVIDIAFDIGRRIDARYPGYSENVVRIVLGINGGRNWFQHDAARNY